MFTSEKDKGGGLSSEPKSLPNYFKPALNQKKARAGVAGGGGGVLHREATSTRRPIPRLQESGTALTR